jgi:hypothetical protein
VLIPRQRIHLSQIAIAGTFLVLAGCGAGTRSISSGNFSGIAFLQPDRAMGITNNGVGVARVTLSSTHLTSGASTEITVNLSQPAPDGGAVVQLTSSDANVVAVPATLSIPAGRTSATVASSTSSVDAGATVAISALYGNTVAGTSLVVAPQLTPAFKVTVQPSTFTINPGQSGSATVTTTVKNGYDHSLQLSVLKVPAGVSVSLTPSVIPAPGAGTSKAKVTVSSSAVPGTYSLRVKASDGTTSRTATLTLTVASSGPGATFQGCWYHQSGHRYQGVRISVANPGTYPFDADLYFGATCDPNNQADEFGYGTPLNFGGFDYIFWFADFADQSGTSALWHVGSDTSQCVNYLVAPDC